MFGSWQGACDWQWNAASQKLATRSDITAANKAGIYLATIFRWTFDKLRYIYLISPALVEGVIKGVE